MNLTVNGEYRTVGADATVALVVAELTGAALTGTELTGAPLTGHVPARGVAVAVNGDVVPRSAWGATALSDGDAVEILTAVQGG